jgi:hypothetical protein
MLDELRRDETGSDRDRAGNKNRGDHTAQDDPDGAQNLGTRCVWSVAQTLIVVHDDCDSELEKDAPNIKTAILSVKLCTQPYFVRFGT